MFVDITRLTIPEVAHTLLSLGQVLVIVGNLLLFVAVVLLKGDYPRLQFGWLWWVCCGLLVADLV